MAAPAPLVPCLYTTVKNISGFPRSFGFLGMHGKLLQPGQEYSEWGDIWDKFQPGTQTKTRKRLAFEKALAGFGTHPASLHIKQSAANVIYDTGAAKPQVITLVSGVFGVADPCWGAGY